MTDGAGRHLKGQALVDKYREDIAALIASALSAHAEVLLIGQAARADSDAGNELVDALNAMYVELASESGIRFVDAGAAIEKPDGSFARVLWCLPDE